MDKLDTQLKNDLSNLLLGLMHYQDYAISFNGDGVDRSVDELIERFDMLADDTDLKTMTEYLDNAETDKIMEFLSYSIFDFYFKRDAE